MIALILICNALWCPMPVITLGYVTGGQADYNKYVCNLMSTKLEREYKPYKFDCVKEADEL